MYTVRTHGCAPVTRGCALQGTVIQGTPSKVVLLRNMVSGGWLLPVH